MIEKKAKGDLLAKQLVLKDLIAYQEGAVVSRALIDKKVGTVTIFAFDEGQGLSEHAAPYDALVQVLDGGAEIRIEGKQFSLKEGEMIILPANRPHALRALSAFKMLLIMIRSEDSRLAIVSEPAHQE
jgi:quercetin dioxygenase-like cupin family protein